ncbi:hypothetical protein GCM10027262_21410 [Nocardia tengchongensis]
MLDGGYAATEFSAQHFLIGESVQHTEYGRAEFTLLVVGEQIDEITKIHVIECGGHG